MSSEKTLILEWRGKGGGGRGWEGRKWGKEWQKVGLGGGGATMGGLNGRWGLVLVVVRVVPSTWLCLSGQMNYCRQTGVHHQPNWVFELSLSITWSMRSKFAIPVLAPYFWLPATLGTSAAHLESSAPEQHPMCLPPEPYIMAVPSRNFKRRKE